MFLKNAIQVARERLKKSLNQDLSFFDHIAELENVAEVGHKHIKPQKIGESVYGLLHELSHVKNDIGCSDKVVSVNETRVRLEKAIAKLAIIGKLTDGVLVKDLIISYANTTKD